MSQPKRKRVISIDALEKLDQKLSDLDEKPQSEFNLRESIAYLADKLKSALRKGYSYQDLTEILRDQNISVSTSMLRRYLKEAEENPRKSPKKPKNKKKSSGKITSNDKNYLPSGSSPEQKNNRNKTITNNLNSDSKTPNIDNSSKDRSSKKAPKEPKKVAVLSGIDDDLSNEFNNY